jgi:hypothetical protein
VLNETVAHHKPNATDNKYKQQSVVLSVALLVNKLRPGACLDPKYFPKFHYAKRRFTITSKYRHMYGVLNVDEIKN